MSAAHGVPILLQAEGVRIPGDVVDLASFRRWLRSDAFPERGRIDWVGGEMEIDMPPEDLNTHGSPKVAITAGLSQLVEATDLGVVYVDSTRLSAPEADLSSEPDVVVLLFESLESGRVRPVRKAGGAEDRFVELEGSPDLVVECLSDFSVAKDRERLSRQYHRAGIREYWLVDARKPAVELSILFRGSDDWVRSEAGADGFTPSAILGVSLRLVRLAPRAGLVRHRLETRARK